MIDKNKRILFVANNLSSGGIQTSLINLLRYLSENQNNKIDLFLFSANSERIKEIPNNVNIIKGNYLLGLTSNSFKEIIETKNILHIIVRLILMIIVRIIKPDKLYKLLFNLNKNKNEYDIAVSYFNDIPNTYFNRGATDYVLNYCNAKKKIGWIHSDIQMAGWEIEYFKKIYCKFDYIVNVSKHCKEIYDKLIPEQKEKSLVAYNIFPIQHIKESSKDNQNEIIKNDRGINLITVARLDLNSKRIDRIIEVCKMLIDNKIENFKWFIVGDGSDYKSIKNLIEQYGLTGKVILLGNKVNPYPYIKASDIFVLTSEYEGYPMVVGESLVLGIPVLTTNYSSAKEQIKEGYNGFVVEKDIKKIYLKIKELLIDNEKIQRLKNNINKDKFSNNIAMKQIDKIFGDENE